MSLALGVTKSAATAAGNPLTTVGITTAASGSGLVVFLSYSSAATFTSVTDNQGNGAPTLVGTELSWSAATWFSRCYYWPKIAGGAGHTVSLNVSVNDVLTMFVMEVTTTNGQGITLDQASRIADAASPFDSSSITTTIANEILLAAMFEKATSGTAVRTLGNSFIDVTADDINDANTFLTGASSSQVVSATLTRSSKTSS